MEALTALTIAAAVWTALALMMAHMGVVYLLEAEHWPRRRAIMIGIILGIGWPFVVAAVWISMMGRSKR